MDHKADIGVAVALIGRGDALVDSDRYGEAVASYDQVIDRFGETNEHDLLRQVRIALRKKGSALVSLDRFDEADMFFDALCRLADDAPDPEQALSRAQDGIARIFYKRVYALVG